MNNKAPFTQSDVKRAIAGAQKAGLTIYECIVGDDGVRLITTKVDTSQDKNNDPQPKQWSRSS